MKRIQILSKQTANQIAAGEVVERPASIVKELVENSIDAGSTSISVEITGGGIEYIRVTDNGSGILAQDVPTAFLRHATSKIFTTDDLEHIETLGFRGEALASIAAVSQLSMRTRTKDAELGMLIKIEGDKVVECVPAGCTEGTSIEVRSVFYNVPARLKFLKSSRAEASRISDYMERAIIGNPGISFKFISNGKQMYQSRGDGNLKNALFCVYGGDMLPYLKEVDFADGRIVITGFVGMESIARANRMQQSLYVNERYIRSQKISYAVQRAFDTRLMTGRFPFYALNLTIGFEEIDVNVHPNKMDVRFKNEEYVTRAFTIAVRKALGDPVAPVLHFEDLSKKPVERPIVDESALRASVRERLGKNQETHERQVMREGNAPIRQGSPFDALVPLDRKEELQKSPLYKSPTVSVPLERPANQPEAPCQEGLSFGLEPYRIVGQLFDCYWVVQQGNIVFFIDQHAAHERRLYEQMMQHGLRANSQVLLVPIIMKLTAQEYMTLTDNLDRFSELGFDIEDFGMLTVSIRAVPDLFGQPETTAFFHEAIVMLDQKKRVTAEEMKRAALIQAACKHAIKAGDVLDQKEIEALLQQYVESGVPMTCPHGRPVMVYMTKLEFEKMFKRIV